jgi:membrane-associated protease RseP (regulator of RpoE activity)
MEQRRSVLLFFATLASVYLVYGFRWTAGNPLTDPDAARDSAKFALALMAILLSHEMAHYVVAKRHGFSLSLPYFLPFPAAFGTFGAIIRLRSLPTTRAGLLEMGAAGPIAGFVVAMGAIALGLPGTVEHAAPELLWDPSLLDALAAPIPEQGVFGHGFTVVMGWLGQSVGPVELPMMVLANPPIMDLLGTLIVGAPPSRYAALDPLATAGWVGCLLTAINMMPIGQLDGGHIMNAMSPRWAPKVSKGLLGFAVVAGIVWTGWIFWALMLMAMGAWRSLPVPTDPPLTLRSRWVGALAVCALILSFMARPIQIEGFELTKLAWVDTDGLPISAEIRATLALAVSKRLDREASRR